MSSIQGLFPYFGQGKVVIPALPACGKCGLCKKCLSPKMSYSGKGKREILVIGESPGKQEDIQGKPFVGPSGELLENTLRKFGVNLRRDCWITNSAICHPSRNILPDKAVDYCRPNIVNTIRELNPRVIILLGASAVRSVIAWIWKEEKRPSVNRWVGWKIPNQKLNAWIVPTWHPAHLLRSDSDRGKGSIEVIQLFWEKHLQEAISLEGRPWEVVPNYKKECTVIYDSEEAARYVRLLGESGRPIAFDYETDRLKPDHKESRILCCSISCGKVTYAFPWYGSVVTAMREFLCSSSPKYAWNLKFEDRWTRKIFGFGVRNWLHDGMLAAHTLDNRPGICSLKFQSFVKLGMEDYDSSLKPYMVVENSNARNRLHEVPIEKLLLYNALDSLLTYKICEIQRKEMGFHE